MENSIELAQTIFPNQVITATMEINWHLLTIISKWQFLTIILNWLFIRVNFVRDIYNCKIMKISSDEEVSNIPHKLTDANNSVISNLSSERSRRQYENASGVKQKEQKSLRSWNLPGYKQWWKQHSMLRNCGFWEIHQVDSIFEKMTVRNHPKNLTYWLERKLNNS